MPNTRSWQIQVTAEFCELPNWNLFETFTYIGDDDEQEEEPDEDNYNKLIMPGK